MECRERYESLRHQLANSRDRQLRMRARIARSLQSGPDPDTRAVILRTSRLLAIERQHFRRLRARKLALARFLPADLLEAAFE